MELPKLTHPVVQAPMAGGPATPQLAAAVSQAGGLGFLAAGYKAADAVRREIQEVRAQTAAPFGVNLFVPSTPGSDQGDVDAFAAALAPEVDRYGVPLGRARWDDDAWSEKLSLVAEERVPLVSFTFGCPPTEVVERLHSDGIAVAVTVTSPEEAEAAEAVGADALVVQGLEAGAHQGSFGDEDDQERYGLLVLLRLVAARTSLPLVASGGIVDGAGIAAVLVAGARAAQLGTAFLRCPEAGTSQVHRNALAERRSTVLTRAFTGRHARALVNRFVVEHHDQAPAAYPQVHHLTAPLRAAAREMQDSEGVNLWAGQGYSLTQEAPAAEVVASLASSAREALQATASSWPVGPAPNGAAGTPKAPQVGT